MAYQVTVNGKTLLVDTVRRSGSQICFSIDGQNYDVDVSAVIADRTETTSTAPVSTARRPTKPSPSAAVPGDVRSPMPGIIVNVLVKVGDTVTAGQTVVVMEAMKMENNIPSVTAGVVSAVHVQKGQEIENNGLLISIGK